MSLWRQRIQTVNANATQSVALSDDGDAFMTAETTEESECELKVSSAPTASAS